MSDAVEIERHGDSQPGLVVERRRDEAGDLLQERVVVACLDDDSEVLEYDTAADRVDHIDGPEAQVVQDIIGDRVEVTDGE